MKYWVGIWLVLYSNTSLAAPLRTAQEHIANAEAWVDMGEYQKAIEEYQQAYLAGRRTSCLFLMAQSYERLADMPTRAAFEALHSKRQALYLYESYLRKTPITDSEAMPFLESARARIEPLRQEIKELTGRLIVDREELSSRLKGVEEMLQRLIDHFLPQERKETSEQQRPNSAKQSQ